MAQANRSAARRPEVKRSERRARRRRMRLIGGAGGAVAVILVGYFAYQASTGQPGVRMPDQGNLHIQTETTAHEPYNSDPPTSGPHLPYIAPWGVHTKPISKELQVHNLEDGGVMVQYNCDCPAEVERLRATVQRYDRHVILAPYPGMKTRFALTAWTRIEQFDDLDDKPVQRLGGGLHRVLAFLRLAEPEGDYVPRVKRFIDTYQGIDHHKR